MTDVLDRILLGVLIAMLLACATLLVVNANLRASLAAAEARAATVVAANGAMKAAIDRQNAAIIALQQTGQMREKHLQQAMQQARQSAQKLAARSVALDAIKGKDCQAAQSVWRAYLKDTK